MSKDPEEATPEEEGLAKTAELGDEHREHYAEMNKEAQKNKDEGKAG